MQLKVAIINLAMGIVLIFLIVKTVGVWQEKEWMPGASPPEKIQGVDLPQTVWNSSLPSEKVFDAIVGKNLFSPDRSEYVPPEPEEEPVEEVAVKKIQGKQIALYGVFIRKENSSALINNPESGKDQPKYRWVNKGDKFGNLTVAGIEKDHVLIRQGSQKYKIMLNDKGNKSIARSTSGTDSVANVVVTGTAETSPSRTPSEERKQASAQEGYETVTTPFGSMQIRKK